MSILNGQFIQYAAYLEFIIVKLTLQVSAGELSFDIAELERRVSQIFQIASRWKALLLFDEADVFVTKRGLHFLERNRFVAIFLRKLEYFEGIQFLTTN